MNRETDMFNAVASFLLGKGYDVRAEVNNCDIVGMKDDEIVIVELKLKFNIDLLLQASDRLRYTNNVYIAIPHNEINLFKKKGKKKRHLLRTLEVGLLTVKVEEDEYIVKEVLEPKKLDKKILQNRNKKKRERLINEFKGRESLKNIGGSTRVSIHTAYKELAIKIANELKDGPLSTRELRDRLGDNKKITSILQKNFYGWFIRVERGVYKLNEDYDSNNS